MGKERKKREKREEQEETTVKVTVTVLCNEADIKPPMPSGALCFKKYNRILLNRKNGKECNIASTR